MGGREVLRDAVGVCDAVRVVVRDAVPLRDCVGGFDALRDGVNVGVSERDAVAERVPLRVGVLVCVSAGVPLPLCVDDRDDAPVRVPVLLELKRRVGEWEGV